MPFVATVGETGGDIKQVIYLVSGDVIATLTNYPWKATWTNTMPGSYTAQAAAMDDLGNWATSAVAYVTLYSRPSYDITLDNLSTDVSFSGDWATGTTNYFHSGPDCRVTSAVSGSSTAVATYTPIIPSPGFCDIFAFIPSGPNPSTNSPWTIQFDGGITNFAVNEAVNGGHWIMIAPEVPFPAGTNAHVLIANNSGEDSSQNITADTLRFTASTSPFILKQPATNPATSAGNQAALTVTANGSTPLHYQWRLNGTDIQNATQSRLTVPRIANSNAGPYSVIVTNASGGMLSSNSTFVVFGPPRPNLVIANTPTDGTITMSLQARSGVAYGIEVSSNLTDWISWTNLYNTGSSTNFSDTVTNILSHYYRARWLPF
jgi:hypothetical protein